jgi:hypothetical protein
VVGRIQTQIKFIFTSIILLFLLINCTNLSTKTTDIPSYNTKFLRSGDIILRKSYGLISEIVVMQLNDTLNISHCGVIIKDSSDNVQVIHSLSKKVSDSDGVQICTLSEFLNASKIETVRIVRFRDDTLNYIPQKAQYYLEQKIPFDEKFNMSDTTTFFCSEFPIHILKTGFDVDISFGSRKPTFSVFLNNRFFDEVPFVE